MNNQEYLLRYIEEENNEENFENLTNLFKEQNIYSNRLDQKTLLHILNRISKHIIYDICLENLSFFG